MKNRRFAIDVLRKKIELILSTLKLTLEEFSIAELFPHVIDNVMNRFVFVVNLCPSWKKKLSVAF